MGRWHTETALLTASTSASTSGFRHVCLDKSSDGGTVVTYADSTYPVLTDDGEDKPPKTSRCCVGIRRVQQWGGRPLRRRAKLTFLPSGGSRKFLLSSPVSISADGSTAVTSGSYLMICTYSQDPSIRWSKVLKAAKLGFRLGKQRFRIRQFHSR